MSKRKKKPRKSTISRKIAGGVGTVVEAAQAPFEPPFSLHLPDIVYVDDLFTVGECETIINYSSEWERTEGRISARAKSESGGVESKKTDYRICTLYRPPENLKQIDWINEKLLSVITGINQDYYRFDIKAFIEPPNLMKYEAEKSGHYDYHLDIGQAKPNCWRKLSYTLFLNDGYEGGTLEFKTGEGMISYTGPVSRMIIFPSYLLHKVNPVTSGTRWAMVGWAHGASVR